VLKINKIFAIKLDAIFFTQENVAPSVENADDIKVVLLQFLGKKRRYDFFEWVKLIERTFENILINSVCFVKRFSAVRPHIENLVNFSGGCAEVIDAIIDIHNIDIGIINQAFQKDSVGFRLENQKGYFADGKEVGRPAVDVPILEFKKGDVLFHCSAVLDRSAFVTLKMSISV